MKLLSFLGLSLIIIIHFIYIISCVAIYLKTFKKKIALKLELDKDKGWFYWVSIVSFSVLLSFYITFVF
jgi:hypothetical protein